MINEGLKDPIPDVFQLDTSEADPVSDKVHLGVELAEMS